MRAATILLVLVTVAGICAADEPDPPKPPDGWKHYEPKDKSFTVLLPEKGKEKDTESTIFASGNILKLKMAKVEQEGGLTYSAGVLVLPLKARKIDPAELLKAVGESFVKEVKGKIADEKDVKQGKVSGKEFVVETGQGLVKLRAFVVDGRIYRAEISGTKEQVETDDAKTFMGSFKLPARYTKVPMP